jgi:hypothetical protein
MIVCFLGFCFKYKKEEMKGNIIFFTGCLKVIVIMIMMIHCVNKRVEDLNIGQ